MTDDLHHLAGAYALDALEPAERRAFEQHLSSCAGCQTEVAEFRETAARLAEAEPVDPPAGLRARVLADTASNRQLPPEVAPVVEIATRRRPRILPAVAALLVAVAGTVGVVLATSDDDDPVDEVVAAADATTADLDGEPGSVEVVWSQAQNQAAVIADGVVDPAEGETYALWFVTADGVQPAGLFTSDDGRVATVIDLSEFDIGDGIGWGISIEPDGGSPQPTGDVLYLGLF